MELPRRRLEIENVTVHQVQFYVGRTSNQILEVNDVTMSSLCLRFLFFLCLTNVLASMPQVVLYPETEKPGLYNCYRISHSKQIKVKNNQLDPEEAMKPFLKRPVPADKVQEYFAADYREACERTGVTYSRQVALGDSHLSRRLDQVNDAVIGEAGFTKVSPPPHGLMPWKYQYK